MVAYSTNRLFDFSTLFSVTVALILLISLPGSCWSEETETPDDVEEVTTSDSSEPTPPPMMEIVEPDASGIETGTDSAGGEAGPVDATGEASEVESDQHDGTYVVQPGDTLFGIAVQLGVSIDALMEENGIDDPNSLQVGQVLQVP